MPLMILKIMNYPVLTEAIKAVVLSLISFCESFLLDWVMILWSNYGIPQMTA